MQSLVTGGAGFIGSHLVEKLISMGHDVIILDDFSTGREQNLVNIQGHSRLQVHKLDVCDEKAIEPYFLGVDWVFHLAALADIVPSIQHPLTYLRAGVGGTQAVLEASRLANVKRLVYAASSSCYGIPDLYPTPESSPISPQYPYALTKLLGTSAWYAPGASVAYLVKSILNDSKETLPCSVMLNGEYNVEDLCIGVPCIIGSNGLEEIIEINLNDINKERFLKSVEAVKNTNLSLKGLI